MRSSVTFILFFLLIAQGTSYASSILSITGQDLDQVLVSQEKKNPFRVGEAVCFRRLRVEVACGEVMHSDVRSVVIKILNRRDTTRQIHNDSSSNNYVELVFERGTIYKTDKVVRKEAPKNSTYTKGKQRGRKLASSDGEGATDQFEANEDDKLSSDLVGGLISFRREPDSVGSSDAAIGLSGKEDLLSSNDVYTESDDEPELFSKPYVSNLSIGLNYLFPNIQYQQNLFDSFAVGLLTNYIDVPISNGTLSGFGGMLTINSYGREPFKGPWFQLGTGLYSLTGKDSLTKTSYISAAAMTNMGWRWLWNGGLNFGLGLGVQYIFTPKPANSTLDFSGLLPSISLDLGLAF